MRKIFVVELMDNDPIDESFEAVCKAVEHLNKGSLLTYRIEPGQVIAPTQDDVEAAPNAQGRAKYHIFDYLMGVAGRVGWADTLQEAQDKANKILAFNSGYISDDYEGIHAVERYDHKVNAMARLIIENARKALGHDLNGSLTDLLLDNIPSLKSVEDARKVLRQIGEVR